MHIFTLAIGPASLGIDWRGPSWFWRGWRGWVFSYGKNTAQAEWHVGLCGLGVYLGFYRW